jgi:hypothetical protein
MEKTFSIFINNELIFTGDHITMNVLYNNLTGKSFKSQKEYMEYIHCLKFIELTQDLILKENNKVSLYSSEDELQKEDFLSFKNYTPERIKNVCKLQ